MNVVRCTIIDGRAGVSFIVHGDALPALVAACTHNPQTLEELLSQADQHYHDLRDYVLNGLAIFDEMNVPNNYTHIHEVLSTKPPHETPPFRIVDEMTREFSLQPVKAGAILFNLRAKRIVQLANSYREIRRSGRFRVFDGSALTNAFFSYRLPEEWALVP